MPNPDMVMVELSKQELMVLVNEHRKQGGEILDLAKMVEEEGIDAADMRLLAAKRFHRAIRLVQITQDMAESYDVPA